MYFIFSQYNFLEEPVNSELKLAVLNFFKDFQPPLFLICS